MIINSPAVAFERVRITGKKRKGKGTQELRKPNDTEASKMALPKLRDRIALNGERR